MTDDPRTAHPWYEREIAELLAENRKLRDALRGIPHAYTVDVVLHGVEAYPCVLCGETRNAQTHQEWGR